MNHQKSIHIGVLLGILLLAVLLASCGGPHSSPEKIAEALIETLPSEDCQKIASFYSPAEQDMAYQQCAGPYGVFSDENVISVRIDEVLGTQPTNWGATQVVMTGEFDLSVRGLREWQPKTCKVAYVRVSQIGDDWYIGGNFFNMAVDWTFDSCDWLPTPQPTATPTPAHVCTRKNVGNYRIGDNYYYYNDSLRKNITVPGSTTVSPSGSRPTLITIHGQPGQMIDILLWPLPAGATGAFALIDPGNNVIFSGGSYPNNQFSFQMQCESYNLAIVGLSNEITVEIKKR